MNNSERNNSCGVNNEEDEDNQCDFMQSLPPAFPDYEWSPFIQQGVNCGTSKAQQDILLLSIITTLGATASDFLCFFYGSRMMHPCLQVFIIAPPASGKGAMGWAAHLADDIHDERVKVWEEKAAQYRLEKAKWDGLGKERFETPEPERPRRSLFFISGDNTGTGILENLVDQEGMGMIAEPEASILSATISSDYGNWSHTLRQAFDHDGISYNRRTNYEYRECKRLLLSVLISGTPGQLVPLIPSAENGLFSRELFYYMPAIRKWVDQFDDTARDYPSMFTSWGKRWKRMLDVLHKQVTRMELVLTPEQRIIFNQHMEEYFAHGCAAYGDGMSSAVTRIAINLLRIMTVVAFVRAMDSLLMTTDETVLSEALANIVPTLLTTPGIEPAADVPAENIADRIVTRYTLHITPEDFEAVIQLSGVLYRHSAYAYRQLPESAVNALKKVSKKQRMVSALPMTFTRQEALDVCAELGMSEHSCDIYLSRLCDSGVLKKMEQGVYHFATADDKIQ